MPKMRTHSATKKRFAKTRNGKVKRTKAYRRHHAWAKSSKQRRRLRLGDYLIGTFGKNISRLLPYL